VLFLTKHHAMKTYWGAEVWLPAFLTSALDGGELSASRPGRFTPKERAPGTHWIAGWVVPRAGLDAVVNRKIPSPCRDSNPWSFSPGIFICHTQQSYWNNRERSGSLVPSKSDWLI